ncbi:30S ribosomal protein S8 [Candidatus Woesearchaeota archaeon]|nr:30S ribosomal protein S8 [Candidatus Woesearchaeota archaeon]
MTNDTLATGLTVVKHHDKLGRKECYLHPISKTIKNILGLLNQEGYIGAQEEITTAKGGKIKVNLLGNINNLGVVKPRFAVKMQDFEKFEKRYLPAKEMGILVVSTPNGIMTHRDAKKKGTGGRLLAYCY